MNKKEVLPNVKKSGMSCLLQGTALQEKKTGSKLTSYWLKNINRPLLFNKKGKANIKIIPLKPLINDTGLTKHFPAAAQEWVDSVYSYNANYNKSLTSADNNLMNIVKSYLYLDWKKKRKIKKSTIIEHNSKYLNSKRKRIRNKRLSLNKIFVAKGNVKHTSSSAIITLYVYNLEEKILNKKTKNYAIISKKQDYYDFDIKRSIKYILLLYNNIEENNT